MVFVLVRLKFLNFFPVRIPQAFGRFSQTEETVCPISTRKPNHDFYSNLNFWAFLVYGRIFFDLGSFLPLLSENSFTDEEIERCWNEICLHRKYKTISLFNISIYCYDVNVLLVRELLKANWQTNRANFRTVIKKFL